MSLYFVTCNENKVKEVRGILGRDISRVNLDIEEIQDLYISKVVQDKAMKAYDSILGSVIVEDTGLYIAALKDFPGALTKFVMDSYGCEGLCKQMQDYEDKSAMVETIVGYYDGIDYRSFIGRQEGRIADIPQGKGGFGFDPIFIPEDMNQTLGELTLKQKNAISTRSIAFKKFKKFIDERDGRST